MTGVRGTVAPGFKMSAGSSPAFLDREVAEHGDPGAQLAAYVDGRRVVDLWSDALPGDDPTGVFSISKGAPLLSEATAAEFATPYSPGPDLVTGEPDHFGLGFETVRQKYPYLGAGAFGHGGAAGGMGWADPASGVAYGYVRRRFAWPPGGGAAENEALGAAIVRLAARTER